MLVRRLPLWWLGVGGWEMRWWIGRLEVWEGFEGRWVDGLVLGMRERWWEGKLKGSGNCSGVL